MKKILSFAFVCAFVAMGGASFANAQETNASASAEVNVSTEAGAPKLPPLQDLRARAEMEAKRILEQKKAELRAMASSTKGAIIEKRDELRDEMRDKASSTRADIMEKRDEIRGDIKEKRQDARELASSTRAEARGEVKAEVKARIAANLKDKVAKTTEHAVNMVGRLSEIVTKIESRIAKMSAEGINTSAAVSALADAKLKIAAADVSAKAIANVAVSEEDPRSSLEVLKTATEAARAAIKSAHEALMDIIPTLKISAQASINSAQ